MTNQKTKTITDKPLVVIDLDKILTSPQKNLLVAMYRVGPTRLHHIHDIYVGGVHLKFRLPVIRKLVKLGLVENGKVFHEGKWEGRLTTVGRREAKRIHENTYMSSSGKLKKVKRSEPMVDRLSLPNFYWSEANRESLVKGASLIGYWEMGITRLRLESDGIVIHEGRECVHVRDELQQVLMKPLAHCDPKTLEKKMSKVSNLIHKSMVSGWVEQLTTIGNSLGLKGNFLAEFGFVQIHRKIESVPKWLRMEEVKEEGMYIWKDDKEGLGNASLRYLYEHEGVMRVSPEYQVVQNLVCEGNRQSKFFGPIPIPDDGQPIKRSIYLRSR